MKMSCHYPSDLESLRSITVFHYPEGCKVVFARPEEQHPVHSEMLKELVAEKCGLKKESLVIFGIFLGSPDNPLQLIVNRVPEQVVEVSMLRLTLGASKEEEVIENDPTARHMIFCELKKLYRCDYLLPMPEGQIKDQINKLLCSPSSDSETKLIRMISKNFYTYTSKNNLVTSPRNITKAAPSLSQDIVPIKVAIGLDALKFYDISGEEVLMNWPLSSILCIRDNYKHLKVMVFYIAVNEPPANVVMRPIFLTSLCSDYLGTVCAYIKSRVLQLGNLSCYWSEQHYPYLLQEVSSQKGLFITRIESYHRVIFNEMGMLYSDECKNASYVSLMEEFGTKSILSTLYYPKETGCEFEAVEGINVRTIELVSKTDRLKVQIPVYSGRKMRVNDLMHSLSRHYGLVSMLCPDTLFQVYDTMASGDTVPIVAKSIIPDCLSTLHFKRSVERKLGHKNAPPASLAVNKEEQKSHNENLQVFCSHSAATSRPPPHPLEVTYSPPSKGTLAPTNTPEEDIPVFSLQQWFSPSKTPYSKLLCTSRNPFRLLERVADKLAALVALPPQQGEALPPEPCSSPLLEDRTACVSLSSSTKKRRIIFL